VLAPDYWPDQATFIQDYLALNPSRNRALDLLPLLAHLDPVAVKKALPGEKVNARPTLHYRLPNSDIDNPHWHLLDAWQDWQQVELLVQSPEQLDDLCRRYLRHLDRPLPDWVAPWSETVELWLSDRS
jgi:hypothetical protein